MSETTTEEVKSSSSKEEGVNLASLPNKVLTLIFSYLDSTRKKDLHSITLVCRKFSHVAVSYPRSQWEYVQVLSQPSRNTTAMLQALFWPRFYVSLRKLVFW